MGLCIITTRQPVADVAHHLAINARELRLAGLPDDDGAALLRQYGVVGPEQELHAASKEFGGHPLALHLLGTYLRDVFGGDVGKRNKVELLDPANGESGQAIRVMASYEKHFGVRPELSILRLIGFFDRVATKEELDVLLAEPALPGLTEPLVEIYGADEEQRGWQRSISELRRSGMIREGGPGTLDAHPLVREYFGKQLHALPEARREGHRRLYRLKSDLVPGVPETRSQLNTLFQAAAHGCEAELYSEVFDKVVWDKVIQGYVYHNLYTFGVSETDSIAAARFYERRPGGSSALASRPRLRAGSCTGRE